jgi:methionyl-tRNA synthetase
MTNEKIPFKEFEKMTLQVGEILSAEDHPDADKLYILKVDLAEEEPRQIIAGLRPHYEKEELKGKQAIFITNLEPATIRGVESNGMILAADDNAGTVVFLQPEKPSKPGAKIR